MSGTTLAILGLLALLLGSSGCVRFVTATLDSSSGPDGVAVDGHRERGQKTERAAVDARRDLGGKSERTAGPDLGPTCDDLDVCTVDSDNGTGCGHSSYEAGPCLDQGFAPSTSNQGTDIGGTVAQTFTAGRSGTLAGVNVSVHALGSFLLRVAVRDTGASGQPKTVLAEATLGTTGASLSQLVTFPQTVSVAAGTRYAVTVNYPSAPPATGGTWAGSTGNGYAAGAVWVSEDGVSWSPLLPPVSDQHFRVYVRP